MFQILSLAIGRERIVQLLGFPAIDPESDIPGYIKLEASGNNIMDFR
jgi:hypothetical protein